MHNYYYIDHEKYFRWAEGNASSVMHITGFQRIQEPSCRQSVDELREESEFASENLSPGREPYYLTLVKSQSHTEECLDRVAHIDYSRKYFDSF